jgi:hypothetical protein
MAYNMQPGPISPAQQSFIAKLLTARLKTIGMSSVTDALLALKVTALTKHQASELIERLKGMPEDKDESMPDVVDNAQRKGTGNRPGPCDTCGHPVQQDEGYYFLKMTGKWAVHHKVGACSSAPVPAPVVVDEGLYRTNDGRTIMVYRTQNGRLAGKLLIGTKFQYQQGLVNLAGMGTKLTAEQAAEYGKLTGHCIACCRALTDDRSVTVGYGPVCANRYGWPWG